MSKLINMIGYKTGLVTVIERAGLKKGQSTWLCKCECGKTFVQYGSPLRRGKIKSCGHLLHDKNERRKIAHNSIAKEKHGDTTSRLYFVWLDMRRRCDSPNAVSYKNYGARGITVCSEWDTDYSAFKKWAFENGYNPSAGRGECTLDRIDPNAGYSPENCRWASMREQSNNRRNTYWITFNNETHTGSEWSEITGIPRNVIYSRYKAGQSPERILSKYKHDPHGKIVGEY